MAFHFEHKPRLQEEGTAVPVQLTVCSLQCRLVDKSLMVKRVAISREYRGNRFEIHIRKYNATARLLILFILQYN